MALEWWHLVTVLECLEGLECLRDSSSLDPSSRAVAVRDGPMSSTSITSNKVRPSKVNLVCCTSLFPDYGCLKRLKELHFQRDPLLTCTCIQYMCYTSNVHYRHCVLYFTCKCICTCSLTDLQFLVGVILQD